MPSVRRLAAILAADVAGYSRLMGVDEEGTHERLKAHLGELVNPKIKEHRGRTVKNTGDGLLAEFGSVVDAVRFLPGTCSDGQLVDLFDHALDALRRLSVRSRLP
jgi:class 3 adenylate cyclase